MVYKITFLSEEAESFRRVFEADPEATFLDLSNALLKSVGYPDDQMTSFFICNNKWVREQEITRMEMDSSYEFDNLTMADTHLSEFLQDEKQKLLYVFDPMFDRNFFGELTAIVVGKDVEGVNCIEQKGKAPKQVETEDISKITNDNFVADDDFYGDSEFDIDELDPEGFGDMNFDDSSLF